MDQTHFWPFVSRLQEAKATNSTRPTDGICIMFPGPSHWCNLWRYLILKSVEKLKSMTVRLPENLPMLSPIMCEYCKPAGRVNTGTPETLLWMGRKGMPNAISNSWDSKNVANSNTNWWKWASSCSMSAAQALLESRNAFGMHSKVCHCWFLDMESYQMQLTKLDAHQDCLLNWKLQWMPL